MVLSATYSCSCSQMATAVCPVCEPIPRLPEHKRLLLIW